LFQRTRNMSTWAKPWAHHLLPRMPTRMWGLIFLCHQCCPWPYCQQCLSWQSCSAAMQATSGLLTCP
jgi:hypothetical protein